MNFSSEHEFYLQKCEEAIQVAVSEIFQKDSVVSKAAEYSLLNGGKRVRGILTLATCNLLSDDISCALSFSAAIEMIHAFSLIHDDLPCMDNDNMRRGKPSCHIAFGEANALLAGDLLSLAAFSAIATANSATSSMIKSATKTLAYESGAKGMIYGQELDIDAENKQVTAEELTKIHKYKTGALISAATELGIIAAAEQIESHPVLINYAKTLGLVFQIVDDILDVTGDAAILGKPLGSDIKNAKNTYVSINGLEQSVETANKLTENSVIALQNTYGDKADFLCEFAVNLVKRVN